MRWVMYIMVVANLFAFVWFSHHQESHPGNQKSRDHATPDGVKTIRLLRESEAITDVAVRTQNPPEPVGVCHTIGPFKDHEMADDAVAVIRNLGREGAVRLDKEKVKTGYWVYIKSKSSKEVNNIILGLESKGFKDYHKNERNELSLGFFRGPQDARRRQKRIAALGYSPLVGPRYRYSTFYWVDVAEMKSNMLSDEAWDNYLTRYPDSQRKSVKCDLFNA